MYCISQAEREALYGLPHRCRVLYHELRAYMDIETRTTGVRRGISWQSLREALYVEPHQGEEESGAPHKEAIRRMAKRLEASGLVQNKSEGKRLIFFLPLADTHQSARKKPDTNPTQTRHIQPDTEADIAESHGNAGFEGQGDTEPDTNPTYPKTQKPDTPQDSRLKDKRLKDISAISADGLPPKPDDPEAPEPKPDDPGDPDPKPKESCFDEFWQCYPRKVGKKPSMAKWKAKKLDRDELGKTIVQDVKERIRQDANWRRGFIPNPLTYLTQERWLDEIAIEPQEESYVEKLKRALREDTQNGKPIIQGEWRNG